MTRRCTYVVLLAAVVALSVNPLIAADDEKSKCCEVTCTVEKITDGVRCTVKVEGDSELAAVRNCIRSWVADHAMDGVDVSFEDVDGGLVVTQTAKSADLVESLHAKAEDCGKGGCGFCPKVRTGGCGEKCKPKKGCCAKRATEAV